MKPSRDQLDLVFGPGDGESAEQRALASDKAYIRSLDQLAEHRGRGNGRRLTASEALQAYGFATLLEVAAEGSALLCHDRSAAGATLRDRRQELGLALRDVAIKARLDAAEVAAAEQSKRLSIRIYERAARVLALDERYISVRPEPTEGERITRRLRTISRDAPAMTPSVVATLAEAAWVASRQVYLEERLALAGDPHFIERNDSFGTPSFPAYRWGYHLASEARQRLGLGSEPILSLRDLAESRLGIPVIQTEIGEQIAGATLEVSTPAGVRRAIVLNIGGANRNAYVRRSTLAHELGHLLYDPPGALASLRVDDYIELSERPENVPDRVEQRANAFSVEFLVPQQAAVALFNEGGGDPLARVMHHFGVSFTAAKYHIWNGLERSVPIEALTTNAFRAADDWEGREAFTVDYHPVRNIRPSRTGRFSALAVRAAQEKIISWDTATEWLEADAEDLDRARTLLPELYPGVFEGA
jgi:Zn-dependent peptidase ImmA (M78 family)